jgi:hypothetical protein
MAGNGGPVGEGDEGRVEAGAQGQQTRTASLSELESNVEIFEVAGFVKWFDVARGYGFIIPDNGIADVLCT